MDSLILKKGNVNDKESFFVVVCDGVGSLEDGAFASAVAARMLCEWFEDLMDITRIGIRLRDAVLEINTAVFTEAKRRKLHTASTLTALLLLDGRYYIVHVGDSRVYSYEDGVLSVLTSDDVSASGHLTACIGQTEHVFLQYYEGVGVGKTFLVCSDGLYKRMDVAFMAAKIKSWNKRVSSDPLDALSKYVIERGEQDNISFALVKIEG